MAAQNILQFVEGQGDGTMRAVFDVTAIGTLHAGREASAVEVKKRLLAPFGAVLDCFTDRAGQPEGSGIFFAGTAEIDDVNDGKPGSVDSFSEAGMQIFSCANIMDRFKGRSGGAENDAGLFQLGAEDSGIPTVIERGLLLFITRFVFFIDNDQAQVDQRREHSRACSDDDASLTIADSVPLIMALASAELTVEHGDLHASGFESFPEPGNGLRRERNFRNEDESVSALGETGGEGLQVDLSFSAAGDALQEDGLAGRFGQGFEDDL
jgi:hypothetical protein